MVDTLQFSAELFVISGERRVSRLCGRNDAGVECINTAEGTGVFCATYGPSGDK